MTLNNCKLWSNGIKTASFPKKLQKIAQRLGALPPGYHSLRWLGAFSQTPVCDMLQLRNSTQNVSKIYTFELLTLGLSPLPVAKFWLSENTQTTASDLAA